MHRRLQNLIWAQQTIRPPHATGRGKTPIQKAGLAYERAFGKALPDAKRGLWFEFRDSNGQGKCSPDYVVFGRTKIVVFECKLRWVPEAHTQLTELYIPILRMVYGKNVTGVVVTKQLTRETPVSLVAMDLGQALRGAEEPLILHWLGKGSIF